VRIPHIRARPQPAATASLCRALGRQPQGRGSGGQVGGRKRHAPLHHLLAPGRALHVAVAARLVAVQPDVELQDLGRGALEGRHAVSLRGDWGGGVCAPATSAGTGSVCAWSPCLPSHPTITPPRDPPSTPPAPWRRSWARPGCPGCAAASGAPRA